MKLGVVRGGDGGSGPVHDLDATGRLGVGCADGDGDQTAAALRGGQDGASNAASPSNGSPVASMSIISLSMP